MINENKTHLVAKKKKKKLGDGGLGGVVGLGTGSTVLKFLHRRTNG